jgi:hypothetical protein
MKRRLVCLSIFSLIILTALQPTGCGLMQMGGGTGTLRLLITDKPFPLEFVNSAMVTITTIEVHQTTSAATSQESDNESEGNENERGKNEAATSQPDDSWITIFDGEKSFDLLNLRNGKTDLLADTEIPAGTYDQMRLIVTNGKITLTDGRVFDLKVPSGEQTGIKLHFPFEVPAVQTTTLILDVDLSRAFQAIPSGHIDDVSTIRSFHFQPSLAMKLINVLQAGTISGHVTSQPDGSPVANAEVTAFDGAEEVTSTMTEADGSYVLGGLHTATYRVHASATGFTDADVTDVEVTAGQETANVDIALTPSS